MLPRKNLEATRSSGIAQAFIGILGSPGRLLIVTGVLFMVRSGFSPFMAEVFSAMAEVLNVGTIAAWTLFSSGFADRACGGIAPAVSYEDWKEGSKAKAETRSAIMDIESRTHTRSSLGAIRSEPFLVNS